MGGADLYLLRIRAVAAVHTHFAAILEIAVVRHVDRIRDLAGDGVKLIHLLADDGL